jgi:hypothetical protein
MIFTSTRLCRRPSNPPWKICSQEPKSSRPSVIATATSRPITRNTVRCVPLQVCVAVVLTGTVVTVAGDRFVRRQLLKPILVILMQAGLIVIDEYTAGYVC